MRNWIARVTQSPYPRHLPSCSFCGRSFEEAGPFAEGPAGAVICGSCVQTCGKLIEQELTRRTADSKPQVANATNAEPIVEKLQRPVQFKVMHLLVVTAIVAICLWYGSIIPENYFVISLLGFTCAAGATMFLFRAYGQN